MLQDELAYAQQALEAAAALKDVNERRRQSGPGPRYAILYGPKPICPTGSATCHA